MHNIENVKNFQIMFDFISTLYMNELNLVGSHKVL